MNILNFELEQKTYAGSGRRNRMMEKHDTPLYSNQEAVTFNNIHKLQHSSTLFNDYFHDIET